jgi:hypothetical protein
MDCGRSSAYATWTAAWPTSGACRTSISPEMVRGNWRCCPRWMACRAPTSSSSSLLQHWQIDQPQRLLALHPNRRARLGTFELVPDASDAIRGPDPIAVLADRYSYGPGNDAARGSRGHRLSHADGTPILQSRGAVPARVDQAIRGRRADAADPVERQRRHAVARRIADLDCASRHAGCRGAGRRSERMECSNAKRPARRREPDCRFAGK